MKWPAAVIAALLLAGCSETGTPEQGDLPGGRDVTYGEVEVTDDLGAIAGVLVDPAIVPVMGATISVQGTTLQTTTDEDGLFTFAGLEPGTYFVLANGTGLKETQQSVSVAAGKVSKINMVIQLDTAAQPFHETIQFEWFDSAGVTLVDFAIDLTDETFLGNSVPDQCDECQFFFETSGPVETFVVEAAWEDQVASPAGPTSYYWTLADGNDWTNGYEDGYFQSKEPARVDGNRWGNLTEMQVKMSADETWITVDQTAEIFVSMFYIDAAPEGWSFTAGDR